MDLDFPINVVKNKYKSFALLNKLDGTIQEMLANFILNGVFTGLSQTDSIVVEPFYKLKKEI